jgi:hypothetical protein
MNQKPSEPPKDSGYLIDLLAIGLLVVFLLFGDPLLKSLGFDEQWENGKVVSTIVAIVLTVLVLFLNSRRKGR